MLGIAIALYDRIGGKGETFMSLNEIQHGEKRLIHRGRFPISGLAALIPNCEGVSELVIGFDVIKRIISMGAQQFWKGFNMCWRDSLIWRAIGHIRSKTTGAHMHSAHSLLMHARNQAAPGR